MSVCLSVPPGAPVVDQRLGCGGHQVAASTPLLHLRQRLPELCRSVTFSRKSLTLIQRDIDKSAFDKSVVSLINQKFMAILLITPILFIYDIALDIGCFSTWPLFIQNGGGTVVYLWKPLYKPCPKHNSFLTVVGGGGVPLVGTVVPWAGLSSRCETFSSDQIDNINGLKPICGRKWRVNFRSIDKILSDKLLSDKPLSDKLLWVVSSSKNISIDQFNHLSTLILSQLWCWINHTFNLLSVGADLLRLTRDDLIQICGLVDGIRLNNALQSK